MLTGNLVLAEQLMNQSLHFALEVEDDIYIGCAYRGFGKNPTRIVKTALVGFLFDLTSNN
ncbi:hypothetical protein [Bacillus sp. JJ1562]|uniref:hypothetical protein n=1 Tax=Bacillus sp. JJ1562 TaxID=3122960 RepID=UPI0030019D90